jgi:hypothetical protein
MANAAPTLPSRSPTSSTRLAPACPSRNELKGTPLPMVPIQHSPTNVINTKSTTSTNACSTEFNTHLEVWNKTVRRSGVDSPSPGELPPPQPHDEAITMTRWPGNKVVISAEQGKPWHSHGAKVVPTLPIHSVRAMPARPSRNKFKMGPQVVPR